MAVRSSRSSNLQPKSRSSCQYLTFIAFVALFVFKVDVLISQAISAARRNFDYIPRQVEHYSHPTSYDKTSTTTFTGFSNGTFNRNFILTWGETRGKILEKGELLTLSLDKSSGSGFESKKEYLFAQIDMQIKLVPGNSAGTVTTYYLSSEGDKHDEIDFEFLGNSSGNPYTLHTNVFTQGKGDREQQFLMWFDPTLDFHSYSILWNPKCIIFSVDGIPIREFKNMESIKVPFPKDQAMRLYSSIWNADDWATQGGSVKTDWSVAPFIASYRNFTAEACIWSRRTETSSCDLNSNSKSKLVEKSWLSEELDSRTREEMVLFQQKYMTYNYCEDKWRFPQGPGPECGNKKDLGSETNPLPSWTVRKSPEEIRLSSKITKRPRSRRRGKPRRGNRGLFL